MHHNHRLMKYVIVGTAGHIDHGKSALVEALTGTNPDRLEEEKRRGITIDLGFAHLDLGADLRVGFVDVPGHERFVKNMLAGASGIDLVLLVVAADESIKPQTREHFDICKLLGVRKGLVALTKSDLADRDALGLVAMEVLDFVAGSFLEGAPVVPVSARTGEGLDHLKDELRRVSLDVPAKPTALPFRLPIDRAFVMKGFGAVVTGTLVAGEIRAEDEVEIFPLRRRARVRGIEVHNQPAVGASAGQRTALNLAGVEARDLARGMTLAPPGLFELSDRLDCTLSLLPSARRLKTRTPVHFHCATDEMIAEVVLLQGKELRPGEQVYAQLRLSKPGLYLPGDRFIIRQFSPVVTIGGGTILDNRPEKHHTADPRLLDYFHVAERGDLEARIEKLVERLGETTPAALVARLGQPPAEILRVAAMQAKRKQLTVIGRPPTLLVHPEHFRALESKIVEALGKFHAANPLVPGLSKEELRGKTGWRSGAVRTLPSAALFGAVLQTLIAESRVETHGEILRLKGREVQLSSEEREAKEQILSAFEKAGLAVPSASEVLKSLKVDRRRADKILQILLKEKELVRVTEDLIFHRAALAHLGELVARRKKQSPRINVGVFKELTGLSRKYAIPLLEYLDRERVTRREGDERIIL
jgi:selenocysteine-specific elongation factor